jgi:hypothetical protein
MLGILTQKDLIDALERGGNPTGIASESAPSEGR